MSLALELDQDQRSTLEQIWKERQASGKVRPPMTLPPEPKSEPAVEAKPKGYSRTTAAAAERRAAFLAAVRAKFAEGAMVTIAAAAEAAGVHHVTAGEHIQKLRSRGEWPFGVSRGGRRAKPVIPDFDLPKSKVVAKPAVVAAPAATPVVAPREARDAVNHPAHYTSHPSGIECIQVAEHMGFNLGNALKYVWRADLKNDAIEDLRKARWYLDREIARRKAADPNQGACS